MDEACRECICAHDVQISSTVSVTGAVLVRRRAARREQAIGIAQAVELAARHCCRMEPGGAVMQPLILTNGQFRDPDVDEQACACCRVSAHGHAWLVWAPNE